MANTEWWQRGPVEGIPALLQPVAHAILQARDEVNALMQDFPDELLWEKPAGLASVGFHLQHLSGVLDRLFTYANGLSLTELQFRQLKEESELQSQLTTAGLVDRFNTQVDSSLDFLKRMKAQTLTDFREVGRAKLPSTVMGLLFHAAEHTMRHLGQLLVTSKVIRAAR